MSKNNLRFSPNLGIKPANDLEVRSSPKLMQRKDVNPLNLHDDEPKVMFLSNCGMSVDLEKYHFINYIYKMDYPAVDDCLKQIVSNPQKVAEKLQVIRFHQSNTGKLNAVLNEYMDKDTVSKINEHLYESKITSQNFKPFFHDGAFRVFVIHDYLEDDGNVLYIVFYDPYHLIFPGREEVKNYSSEKNAMSLSRISIDDKYHSKVQEDLIRDFDGLIKKSN